jgi:hypothetical protein
VEGNKCSHFKLNFMQRLSYTCFLIIAIAGMLFTACKKDLMTYDTDNYVQFTGDSTVYTFLDKAATLKQDTVPVRIALIGKLSDADREVSLVVADSSTAVEGKDFTILGPVLLEKDSAALSARVIVHRTADLTTQSKTIWLGLKSSASLKKAIFKNNVKTAYKIVFSDKIEKPSWWDSQFFSYKFSVTRMRFYIDVMGSTASPATFAPSNGTVYTLYKLKVATLEYNATHATPLADENGPITWDIAWIEY